MDFSGDVKDTHKVPLSLTHFSLSVCLSLSLFSIFLGLCVFMIHVFVSLSRVLALQLTLCEQKIERVPTKKPAAPAADSDTDSSDDDTVRPFLSHSHAPPSLCLSLFFSPYVCVCVLFSLPPLSLLLSFFL